MKELMDSLFCVFEHMKRFAECEITHDVESSEIIHSHHVECLFGVFFEAFFEFRYELVSVLQEERLLLFQSTI
jgi:hypothetical protein